MISTAQLRVYLPVQHTEVALEPALVLKVSPVSSRFGLVGEPMDEDAIVTEWRGATFVCPRTPQLRVLEGVLAVRRAYGQLGGVAVIPDEVVREAQERLEQLQQTDPDCRSHILTSAWHVPIRWFVPFHPSEREASVDTSGRPSIRYRAHLRDARMRLEHAHDVLETADLPEAPADELAELIDWVSGFPDAAMLELDYGEVARLLPDDDVSGDDSVANVWEALDALEAEDWHRAAAHYAEIVYRWTVPMAVAYSS